MAADTWRDATWEALARAAAEARWPAYAECARWQARGLRKDALRACRAFADAMAAEPFAARWAFVEWLFEAVLTPRVVLEPVVPFPLRTAVVVPTLWEATATGPEGARAVCWLCAHYPVEVVLRSPEAPDPLGALLAAQLARTPGDAEVRRALARHLVVGAADDAHHLHESRYLGDPAANLARLRRAIELLDEGAASAELVVGARRELARIEAWLEFCRAGAADFPRWCVERGLAPPEGRTHYYRR